MPGPPGSCCPAGEPLSQTDPNGCVRPETDCGYCRVMNGHELFPIINCQDLPGTQGFYERVFGAVPTYQFPETGEPSYLVLRIGTGQLGLGTGTTPALYGHTPLPATGHRVDLCVYVGDLLGVLEAAHRAGASIPVGAQAMEWGETIAYVRDPEGTMLLVIQSD